MYPDLVCTPPSAPAQVLNLVGAWVSIYLGIIMYTPDTQYLARSTTFIRYVSSENAVPSLLVQVDYEVKTCGSSDLTCTAASCNTVDYRIFYVYLLIATKFSRCVDRKLYVILVTNTTKFSKTCTCNMLCI
eukprot:SAG11_NODE_9081_length_946_cov_1.242031_2_plen_131_part_00